MRAVEPDQYIEKLKERKENKRISQDFQLAGLEVATLLKDLKHKSLYIKLAKEHGIGPIMALAKEVVERRNIKNPGAYFMRLVGGLKNPKQ